MTSNSRGDVTRLLEAFQSGDEQAFDQLFSLIYDELRQLARIRLGRAGRPGTLDSVAVVSEAYIKLLETPNILSKSRVQFFALASRAMRSILVDHARRMQREKRGGGARPVPIEDATAVFNEEHPEYLIDLDDALTRLTEINEEASRVVECKFFGGLTIKEIAEALEIPVIRVRRRWDYARAWLFKQLHPTT